MSIQTVSKILCTVFLFLFTGAALFYYFNSRDPNWTMDYSINKRLIVYNISTGTVVLAIEGLCSIEPKDYSLTVICKTGPNQYNKHFLQLSSNVAYFVLELTAQQEPLL